MTRATPDRAAALLKEAGAAPDVFVALEAALREVVGHKLFTVMAIDWDAGEAARIYSNAPEAYPVKGRKPLGDMTDWGAHVLEGRNAWIGRTAEDIRGAFFDHETIAALGCAACINVPAVDGERVLGTLNLLHEAGWYDDADAPRVAPFAALALPKLRAFASAREG